MSVTVNVKQYKEIAELLINVKEQVNVPIFLWGHHGTGKTQINQQIAESLGYNYVVLNLANQTPEDLLGFPDGKGGYVVPNWLKLDSGPTVYFLDEINRAPKYVLQCMFNFINEGRIHTTKINSNDVVIAAGNPSDMNYEVTEFEDKAFLSRFAHFYLEPDKSEVIKYFENLVNEKEETLIHPAMIRSMRTSIEMVDNSTEQQYKVMSEPDNRSLEKIGHLMNLFPKTVIKKHGMVLFSAMVGMDFATIIMENWKTMSEIPSPEEILSMKNGNYPFKNTDLDVITTINGNIAAWIEKNVFFDKGKIKFSTAQYNAFKKYLDYIPRDSEVALIQDLKNRIGLEELVEFIENMDEKYLEELLDVGKNFKNE